MEEHQQQLLLQEFGEKLQGEIKTWMNHSAPTYNIKPMEYLVLFEKYSDSIEVEESRSSARPS